MLWANQDDPGRTDFRLEMYDIDKTGSLVAGAVKGGWKTAGNVIVLGNGAVPVVTVRSATTRLSALFDRRRPAGEAKGIACGFNGAETDRKPLITLLESDNIIGFLVAEKLSFDNADLATILTRVGVYNGTGGFYLRRDNYLTKLPLFAVGRYPSEGRFWVRGVVNRTADNGDNFSHDGDFLKACLLFTTLAYHNKCLSFTGSDGRDYRNELCLDDGTQASGDLTQFTLTSKEQDLVDQWRKVLDLAKATAGYDASRSYGFYQIDQELNTSHSVQVGRKKQRVYDYPILNGELRTLKAMTMDYHAQAVAPKCWDYGLLK